MADETKKRLDHAVSDFENEVKKMKDTHQIYDSLKKLQETQSNLQKGQQNILETQQKLEENNEQILKQNEKQNNKAERFYGEKAKEYFHKLDNLILGAKDKIDGNLTKTQNKLYDHFESFNLELNKFKKTMNDQLNINNDELTKMLKTTLEHYTETVERKMNKRFRINLIIEIFTFITIIIFLLLYIFG